MDFGERENGKEKCHADRMNWHILQQMNSEEKTKLSVSSLLIKSQWLAT